jgi:hypothetical protein
MRSLVFVGGRHYGARSGFVTSGESVFVGAQRGLVIPTALALLGTSATGDRMATSATGDRMTRSAQSDRMLYYSYENHHHNHPKKPYRDGTTDRTDSC